MKKSEAFRKAQEAVLGASLPISQKTEILGVLMWEEYFAEIVENKENENQESEQANETV